MFVVSVASAGPAQHCDKATNDRVIAPLVARLQHELDAHHYALPGGDRSLRAQIADLKREADTCAKGNADDCQALSAQGQSPELHACAVSVWETECTAKNPRSCLALSDAYSATDPKRSSELYTRGTAIYQQACDKGEPTCRDMAFEPMVMRKEPKRALGILVALCDHGDGQACADAGGSLMADSKDRPALLKRGCYAAHPSGRACMGLAMSDEAHREDLEKRACKLDTNTCPRPHAPPPP
jgi:hypothetical protein